MLYVDVRNTMRQHIVVGFFSLGLVYLLNYIFDIGWSTSFARVSYILLFLVLIIGPIMKITDPKKSSSPFKSPWCWRGELGIWFTITALLHFYFVMGKGFINWSIVKALGGGIGGGGLGLANLIGLIALVWAVVLAVTSFNKVINFLGIDSWKWIQNFTYVVFYLVVVHTTYFQFFTTHGSGPDWFGYMSIAMALIVVFLQMLGCIKNVQNYKK